MAELQGSWGEKRQKAVESQAECTNSSVPGLYPAKNRYNALWTNGRARRVRIRLDFIMYLFLSPNEPGIPVSGRCPILNISSSAQKNEAKDAKRNMTFEDDRRQTYVSL